ncbi:MAG: twin transmembrane helix small protein [Gammaproteobacteria bacterium]|nr:twin transmembrane helix small protein [Gammaproteobacteria bacterium]
MVIVGSMGSALLFMMRDTDNSKRTVNALTLRISLSILAISVLLIAAYFGWLTPNRSPIQ